MKITLASPVEPSGASWLINCFLELGVKVCHKPVVDTMWRQSHMPTASDALWQPMAGGAYQLHPRADVLKQFLPILSRADRFRFVEDVEVEYVQDLPAVYRATDCTILFVRDPRDSLYSMYCRTRPGFDFATFLRFPNPDTLLDRPAHWSLFTDAWLTQAGENWFTFEEYKRHAAGLLRRVLERAQLTRLGAGVERAVDESSFEKARAAEERHRTTGAGDWEIVNRAGRIGEWRDRADARSGAAMIERAAGTVMRRLGYQPRQPDPADATSADTLFEFARDVDEDILRRSNLPAHRIRRLLDNLVSHAASKGWACADRVDRLRERFAGGSEHQFAHVRELFRLRRGSA